MTADTKPRRDGMRILLAFLLFFITVASVDAFFVYKALSTHSGVVVENAYEQGLHYNDIIAAARAQQEQELDHEPASAGE